MARLDSKIVMRVDKFLKDTRVIRCINMGCRFIMKDEIQCTFKEISLDSKGFCCEFEPFDDKACRQITIEEKGD